MRESVDLLSVDLIQSPIHVTTVIVIIILTFVVGVV